jgi:hypothetical protein
VCTEVKFADVLTYFTDETLSSYCAQLRGLVDYAGRLDFISSTTWLPAASRGYCIGNCRTSKTMDIVLLGQISAQQSSLNPFAMAAGWSLPFDFADHMLQLSIVDPWTLSSDFHTDFRRAMRNLRLISQTVPFPGSSISDPLARGTSLHIEDLLNEHIVLRFPFFHQIVSVSVFFPTPIRIC